MTTNNFEKLKNNFDKAIQKVHNQKFLVERELKSLEKFVFEEPNADGLGFAIYNFRSIFQPYELHSPGLYPFKEAFEALLLNEDLKDIEIGIKDYQRIGLEEAKELFRYYQYVQDCSIENKKPGSKESFSHKQKLLALHYLGLDLKGIENSKAAVILSKILGLNEENTRQYLSYVSAGKNQVRTIKNLEKVKELFEKEGIETITDKIKADLTKIDK